MDIPKQTAKPVFSTAVPAESGSPRQRQVSDINSLNLQPGKQYPAQVVQSQPSQATSATTQPPATNQSPTANDTLILQKNEYLVRIHAKTILISSEKLLNVGDRLFVSLDPASTQEKPSLIAQIVGQNQSKQTLNSSLPNAAATTNPTTGTTATSQTLNSPQAITQLLQSLNLTLDKQIPLQDGFKNIIQLLSATTSAGNSPATQEAIDPRLRQFIQQRLLGILPQSSDFLSKQIGDGQSTTLSSQSVNAPSPGTLSLNSASTTVKNALLNSGLFLEQKLNGQAEKLAAFNAQLETLRQLSSSPLQPVTETKTAAQTSVTSLNKIQQSIELLLLAAKQGTTLPNSAPTAGDSGDIFPDVKAGLVSVAALLARQLSKELSAEALKNLFMLPAADNHAVSPFAFPLLQTNKLSAAKNLFEKHEFTTGQLLKLLAGMIHRLQFNQLHSLLQSNSNADTPVQQSWFFELPIANPQQQIHTFNFRIDKESAQHNTQTEDTEKTLEWKLLLSFDLEELGPIYIQVKLQDKNLSRGPVISSVLWADNAETVKLLNTESQQLKRSLENLGLHVTELRCEQGQPAQSQTKLGRHLVDTKA